MNKLEGQMFCQDLMQLLILKVNTTNIGYKKFVS